MSDEPLITLPGSRALLGWWRELGPLVPRRMWYAQPVLVRVEALTEVAGLPALDALAHALLGCVATMSPITQATLGAALGIPLSLLRPLLDTLSTEGLIEQSGEEVRTTPTGEQVARSGTEASPRLERRLFRFTRSPAHYVALRSAVPYVPTGEWQHGLELVEQALGQSDEWKRRHGFPLDVQRVLPGSVEPSTLNWPSIPVVAAEQAYLAIVESVSAGRVLGFAVQPDGWGMGREATWEVASAAVLAEVFGEVTGDDWRTAWLGWCQQRNLPTAEAEACRVELQDHRLRVCAPGRLIERLKQNRSDAIKGEAWLTAGAGRLRGLARIELEADGERMG